jgi:hypothetical protein
MPQNATTENRLNLIVPLLDVGRPRNSCSLRGNPRDAALDATRPYGCTCRYQNARWEKHLRPAYRVKIAVAQCCRSRICQLASTLAHEFLLGLRRWNALRSGA